MVEIFHIVLGAMIAIGGGAAYLRVAREPDDETPLPSRHAPRLSLIVTNAGSNDGMRGAAPAHRAG